MLTIPSVCGRLCVWAWISTSPCLIGATIDWEAETAIETTMSVDGPYSPRSPEAKAILSGGAWLTGEGDGTAHKSRWQVMVGTDGRYQLFVRRFWNHGAFRWHFDDQPWQSVEAPLTLLDSNELQPFVPVNWEKLGQVSLTTGPHEFTLELLPNSPMEFNKAYGFDCFKLTDGEFLGQRLSTP